METLLGLFFFLGVPSLIAAIAFSIGKRRTQKDRASLPAVGYRPPSRPTSARTDVSAPKPRSTPKTAQPLAPAPVVPAPRRPTDYSDIPSVLPVKTKQWFFSRSESAFFQALEAALPPEYRVFPNVRLNDLFLIKPGAQQRATYARLRDKHVDFLIVRTSDFRPWLALELDGASHDQAEQQYRDAVKDVVFQSAGLPLLRLRAESAYGPSELRLLLAPYLRGRVVA
ncbi:DUF2726 domain-containing protein [Deinococcus sp. Leaf326]|uniref:DUF2726 domain-containing protein n=1 Tax=Deinococcus sp. Leaf326 TaxID=1736338 RepID=UPI003515204B